MGGLFVWMDGRMGQAVLLWAAGRRRGRVSAVQGDTRPCSKKASGAFWARPPLSSSPAMTWRFPSPYFLTGTATVGGVPSLQHCYFRRFAARAWNAASVLGLYNQRFVSFFCLLALVSKRRKKRKEIRLADFLTLLLFLSLLCPSPRRLRPSACHALAVRWTCATLAPLAARWLAFLQLQVPLFSSVCRRYSKAPQGMYKGKIEGVPPSPERRRNAT